MARTREKSQMPLIRAEKLVLRRGGLMIVENVDIAISQGEIVTLVGPNGAGKTSLVRLLLGLIEPDVGTIFRAAGLSIGYVPQRFAVNAVIPLTVERFLTLTARADAAASSSLLQEVGASHLEDAQISDLSGGPLGAAGPVLSGLPAVSASRRYGLAVDQAGRAVDRNAAAR